METFVLVTSDIVVEPGYNVIYKSVLKQRTKPHNLVQFGQDLWP